MGDVYLLESPSNKYYVGQAVSYLKSGKKWGYMCRWKSHINESKRHLNYCRILDSAIRKYGHENFKIKLLCTVDSLDELNKMEQFYILKYNTLSPNGYNLTSGGNKNQIQSEETKIKRSKSLLGKNKGRILNKRERKNKNDNFLPKYVRRINNGYRISNHPSKIDKCFRSKKLTMEKKLELILIELEKLNLLLC